MDMALVKLAPVEALSDDEQHLGSKLVEKHSQSAKRKPAKRKAKGVRAMNLPPDGRVVRHRVDGACGCQCQCFPFRTISSFEKLMKVRKELAGLEKLEQDNYVQPFVRLILNHL